MSTKRVNSFTNNSYQPVTKRVIRQKDVNLGVDSNNLMKNVYGY